MPRQGGQGKGKPKKKDKDFGVALIKKHFQGNMGFNGIAAQGGRNVNMSSILDNSHLDDFVATTEMSGSEVEVHRVHQNHAFLVEATVRNSVQHITTQQYDYKHLKIPRKPSWNRDMTADEVHRREKDSFLSWRRDIANMENENNGQLRVTPFEKNIEVWRQLWRVLEKSDMAIQIVDARNPLLFYTTDLMTYAAEHSPPRPMMLLINKADYLTEYQRIAWAKHFDTIGIEFVFYSAQIEQNKIDLAQSLLKSENIEASTSDLEDNDEIDDDDENEEGGNIYKNIDLEDIENLVENMLGGSLINPDLIVDNSVSSGLNKVSASEPDCEMVWGDFSVNDKENVHHSSGVSGDRSIGNIQSIEHRERDTLRAKILTREELILFLQLLPQGLNLNKQDKNKGRFCVGMLGYPNVGKSSVINTLLGVSKSSHGVLRVGVSSTPGKTKHFQTLMLNDSIMLCDCPGLVFPSFMRSTGEMICSGILPINQMKEYEEPGEVIASRVPQHLIEAAYGMKVKRDLDFTDNPERPPSSHEMLCSYAALKGNS
jgi:large subunit GTPase 1